MSSYIICRNKRLQEPIIGHKNCWFTSESFLFLFLVFPSFSTENGAFDWGATVCFLLFFCSSECIALQARVFCVLITFKCAGYTNKHTKHTLMHWKIIMWTTVVDILCESLWQRSKLIAVSHIVSNVFVFQFESNHLLMKNSSIFIFCIVIWRTNEPSVYNKPMKKPQNSSIFTSGSIVLSYIICALANSRKKIKWKRTFLRERRHFFFYHNEHKNFTPPKCKWIAKSASYTFMIDSNVVCMVMSLNQLNSGDHLLHYQQRLP